MPFQLTIAEGKEAGREFVFEQPQVVIGRTSECDVVLYDPGVSRQHARIFNEGDAYFVEDMGSSNGTKVNGSVVKKQKLTDGDNVSLGPVVFNFSSATMEPGTNPAAVAPEVADESTRIFTLEGGNKPRPAKGALAPEGADSEQLDQLQRTNTRSMEALARPRVSSPGVGIQRSNPGVSQVRANGTSGPRAVVSAARSGGGLSAAERARIRRDAPGMVGRIKLFWAEASTAVRGAIIGAGGLAVLGLIAAAFMYVAGDPNYKPPPPEPSILTRKPIVESFGYGDGVTYGNRADMKVFDFEFVAATKAVSILHFQCRDISEGEVVVTVNGADIGKLPPDAMDATEVSHEIVIAPELLKKGQKNKIIFDNVRNPPGSDPWRIWNVWIEVVPLPEESVDDLVRGATDAVRRAQQRMDRKDVGASNRYEAWKDYRNAWLMLEAHPNPKPELYVIARTKVREAQQELDHECQMLMLEAVTAYNHKNFEGARATLDHVKDFFPANDQPCAWRADQKRMELGL